MELPQYEKAFNREPEVGKLSDSSFEENAHSLLKGYFKFLPSLEKHLTDLDKLTREELVSYNNSAAQIMYGPRILELFKKDQHNKITELSEEIKERLLNPKREILNSIDFNNLAELVIRPEARFLTDEITSFLRERGYEIILEHPLVISLQQYWAMYNEGFIKSNLYDFPTRTLVYTQAESKVLILRKNQDNLQAHLNALKGLPGIKSSTPTLRGTIIFNGFEKIKKLKRKLFYDSIDPLGMYRAITSGKVESLDPYITCEDPVLYYAGQGIHLPETHELSTNIGLLLDKQKLEDLATLSSFTYAENS